jgi:predicted nucleic acid-binding protein
MSERIVVSDSGPLIALASLGQLDLLHQLYDHVMAPPAVIREVVQQGAGRPGAREVQNATWIERARLEIPPDLFLTEELGAGEAEAIALAQRERGVVLLDEREGRRIAEVVYGLRVRGIVGTLAAAKRSNLIPALRPLLDQLTNSGYFLSPQLIRNACRELGE